MNCIIGIFLLLCTLLYFSFIDSHTNHKKCQSVGFKFNEVSWFMINWLRYLLLLLVPTCSSSCRSCIRTMYYSNIHHTNKRFYWKILSYEFLRTFPMIGIFLCVWMADDRSIGWQMTNVNNVLLLVCCKYSNSINIRWISCTFPIFEYDGIFEYQFDDMPSVII